MSSNLNIFIIPSWYPTSSNPISGIFIKEQIEAVSSFSPTVCQSVSTWGHQSGHLSFSSAKQIGRALSWRFVTPESRYDNHGNRLHDFFTASLSWSHELPFGGVRSIIQANRINLIAAIQKHGVINIIHAHVGYPGGVVARLLSKEFNIPFVLTEHMGPFPMPSLMNAGQPIPELKYAFRDASAVIAVSPFLAERIRYFDLAEPIVIPNMVDESVFFPGDPCLEKFVFFTLCILTAGKGIDDLLRAIAHWNPPPNRFEFWIAGGGPMATTYRALAAKLGISDRVRWIGPVVRTDAANLFRQCHAFVLPSHYETFGMVYAEAIASGKPVIATRCGGPNSIINSTNGVLVDVGDVMALSSAMQVMVADHSRYETKSIRNDFMARFSRPEVVRKLFDVYENIAGKC
jgi:glycosyltransferase involved in cell wall biosynthesis